MDTFQTALELAKLDRRLDCRWWFGCHPLTIFGPTDEAFERLDDEVFETITSEEYRNGHLREILKLHALRGKVTSQDIVEAESISAKSVQGETLTATYDGTDVKINDTKVVEADLEASNGILHKLDGVLLPSFMSQDITEVAENAGIFMTLLKAVGEARLMGTLQSPGPWTVFAPTDEAFAELGDDVVETLLEEPEGLLRDILLYHVVPLENLYSHEIRPGQSYETALEGNSLSIDLGGRWWWNSYLQVNNEARIISADIYASNGVIHVIDKVLSIPASRPEPSDSIIDLARDNGNFETLLQALEISGLTQTLEGEGPFTVLAPTDRAFARLPEETLQELLADPTGKLKDILLYHVLEGKFLRDDIESGIALPLSGNNLYVKKNRWGVRLNIRTNVETFDVEATNGVVHVIDRVLIPPPSIFELISETRFLSTLTTAVEVAGLEETLRGPGPFTLFAPTDRAFRALPDGALDELLDDTEGLSNVLLYHVVPGNFLSDELVDGATLDTALTGETLQVAGSSFLFGLFQSLKVNGDANVIFVDIPAGNGIIHVIDAVLIPPS